MMKDKFANYVIQKALEVATNELSYKLIEKIRMIPDPNQFCNIE